MDSILLARQEATSEAPLQPGSGPYAPKNASLGGRPTIGVDVPITAVFLVLFIIGAVANMTILQVNMRRGHKFLMSGMMFGFCMARISTCVLRIAWATRETNVRLAIAANIFVAAGVVLLFIINLIFAQRIMRAWHPNSGWHPLFRRGFITIYVLIVVSLVMLITATIQSFFTQNLNTRRIDRDIQLYGQTLFAIVSFLPIPIVLVGLMVPRKSHVEKFGSGRWRSKIAILLSATFLLCLGATFRLGTNFKTPRPINSPPVYYNKACFYIFNFTVEILVLILYVVVRVDLRFHVPDGSKGPGDYSGRNKGDQGKEEGMIARKINTEGDVFDNAPEGGSSGNNSPDEEKGVLPADQKTAAPEEENTPTRIDHEQVFTKEEKVIENGNAV